ncbi:DUF4153 domain-containing protein, partial [Fulvivirga sp. RKSG066]|uniref:DUF4153 domain-containing protein n=1 Tax=Fulvivirga aurantia TaxID=2529383 RepID=UPI0012BD6CE1
MIKLPSLNAIIDRAAHSFLRFPLSILSSVAAAAIAMYLFETEPREPQLYLINLMLCFALGIPLFFSVGILSDKRRLTAKSRFLLYIGAVLFLGLIYCSFPDSTSVNNVAIPYIRYAIFNVIVHLIASFAPYSNTGSYNGFWQYNKALFLRILEAILYSGFLYVGLALALGALELLFDVDVHEKLYFHLFIFIVGFFNTWFFLSGVPENFSDLEDNIKYPKGLKVFTQYILLPLLSIYLIILYSYGLKIIISWNWPEGIVSYLIICVAVVGILLVLLLYPYQKDEGSTWVKRFSLLYYVALLPLIVMLFLAIGMRIGDYGITINRYIITLLGIWLSIIALYFVMGKKNIKFIPISLASILLIASFGPWGIFSVSESSQLNRLESILRSENLLVDGKVKNQFEWSLNEKNELLHAGQLPQEGLLIDSLHQEVKSIIEYLNDFHDISATNKYVDQDLDSLIRKALDSSRYVNRTRIYMEAMGVTYYQRDAAGIRYYSYSAENDEVIPVRDYDYLIDVNANNRSAIAKKFRIDSSTFIIGLENKLLIITTGMNHYELDLTPLVNR